MKTETILVIFQTQSHFSKFWIFAPKTKKTFIDIFSWSKTHFILQESYHEKNHTCLTLNWCNSSWFSPLPIGGKEAVEAHNLGGCLQQKSVEDTFKNCPRIAVWPTLCTLLNLRRCNLVLSLFPHKILCPCAKTDSGNNSNVRKGRHDVASAHHKGKCASSSLNFVVSILETRVVAQDPNCR